MDFDGRLKDLGKIDTHEVMDALQRLGSSIWERDSALRDELTGTRPGRSIYIVNDSIPGHVDKAYSAMQRGCVETVMHDKDTELTIATMALLEQQIYPHYPKSMAFRLQFAELGPGEAIQPHRDGGPLSLAHRLHIPLVTDDNIEFIVDGERQHMKKHHLYELNNMRVHHVVNRGSIRRIHLICDLLPSSVAVIEHYDNADSMRSILRERKVLN